MVIKIGMRSDYVHPLLCHLYFADCQVPAAHHCFEAVNQPGERSAIVWRLLVVQVSPARFRSLTFKGGWHDVHAL